MEDVEIDKLSALLKTQINKTDLSKLPALKNLNEDFDDNNEDPEYEMRYKCMQGWFLRCSWLQKIGFLKKLAFYLTNISTLKLVTNIIYTGVFKDRVYVEAQNIRLSLPDKILNDDNRCMEEYKLKLISSNELQWFKTLSDLQQFKIIIGLIKLGDASILNKLYKDFVRILKWKISDINKANRESIKSDENDKALNKGSTKVSIKPSINKDPSKSISKKKRASKKSVNADGDKVKLKKGSIRSSVKSSVNNPPKKSSIETDSEIELVLTRFDDEDDLINPINLAAEDQKIKWENFISGYKKKLGIVDKKEQPKDKKGKGKGKKEKKPKAKKDKNAKNTVDQLQLLPIWINKPILASLDPKSQKSVKKVNKYWGFLIKGIKQDAKSRATLNKCALKMQGRTKPNNVIVERPSFTKIIPKPRDTTSPSLRNKFKKCNTTYSLLTETLCEYNENLNLPTDMQCFPRRVFHRHSRNSTIANWM